MNLEPITQSDVGQKEKDKYCILTYIWNLEKMVLRILFVGQQWRKKHWEQTYGHGERGGESEMYGEINMETFIIISKIDSQQEFSVWLRKLK